MLPDAASALAACRAVHETYQRHGWGHGMAHFIALVTVRGPVPADWASQPAPDPAMFGMPTQDDGARGDLMLGSNGELAHRGGEAVAELLGTSAVLFPGDHGGFLGGEYGQTGEPDAFAARLRDVLAGAG